MSIFRPSSFYLEKALTSRQPETKADRNRKEMWTAGGAPLPTKAPQSEGGTHCPQCGHAHKPGSTCAYMKALIEFVEKGGTNRHPKTGAFTHTGVGYPSGVTTHAGGRPPSQTPVAASLNSPKYNTRPEAGPPTQPQEHYKPQNDGGTAVGKKAAGAVKPSTTYSGQPNIQQRSQNPKTAPRLSTDVIQANDTGHTLKENPDKFWEEAQDEFGPKPSFKPSSPNEPPAWDPVRDEGYEDPKMYGLLDKVTNKQPGLNKPSVDPFGNTQVGPAPLGIPKISKPVQPNVPRFGSAKLSSPGPKMGINLAGGAGGNSGSSAGKPPGTGPMPGAMQNKTPANTQQGIPDAGPDLFDPKRLFAPQKMPTGMQNTPPANDNSGQASSAGKPARGMKITPLKPIENLLPTSGEAQALGSQAYSVGGGAQAAFGGIPPKVHSLLDKRSWAKPQTNSPAPSANHLYLRYPQMGKNTG